MKKIFAVLAALLLIAFYLDGYAHARAGGASRGSMSYGSRGSRTYTPPSRTYQAPSQQSGQGVQGGAQPQTTAAGPSSSRGWLLRSIAGGFIGAVIGNLLFSTLGYGAFGTGAASGVSAFDIVLICLVIFLVYRFMARRREAAAPYYRGYEGPGGYGGDGRADSGQWQGSPGRSNYPMDHSAPASPGPRSAERFEDIRRFDPGFDEAGLRENAQDIFFKVQSAWMKRDFDALSPMLATELAALMRADMEGMRRDGRINRLEDIRLNELDVTEAWVEEGGVFATVRLEAGMIDYTTDESGNVIGGSRTEPVIFTEYWTFSKPVGKSLWRLSAIQHG